MRILFVNEMLGWFGGAEQNVAEAAAALRARGHTCLLAWGSRTERDPAAYAENFDDNAPCAEAGALDGEDLSQVVSDFEPDVIYLHRLPALPPDEARANIRTVRMIHDHDVCCPRRHKYFLLSGRVCRRPAGWRCWLDCAFIARDRSRLFGARRVSIPAMMREMRRNRRLDALLVGSRFMREELLQNGFPEERVHILAPVVRMADARPMPPADGPRVLYVGQLIRGKGVDLLLRALRRLRCDFHADIVGVGPAEGWLKALSLRLGLEDKVSFWGWVQHEDLGRWYSAARVVAVPSRWPEPFGMVGLEAMRYGRPVVGFAVGGVPDWLEHEVTGLLAPEQDVAAFARGIERLLTDARLAAELGRNAADRARTRYSFDGYVDALERHLGGLDLAHRERPSVGQ